LLHGGASYGELIGGCAGGEGLGLLAVLALVALGLFAVIGLGYAALVAAAAARRAALRHLHVLRRRMLTKTYVVEDLSQRAPAMLTTTTTTTTPTTTPTTAPTPMTADPEAGAAADFAYLPAEHLAQLRRLQLLG